MEAIDEADLRLVEDRERRTGGSADTYFALTTPESFSSVGRWYRDFSQTTDENVERLLLAATTAGVNKGMGALAHADRLTIRPGVRGTAPGTNQSTRRPSNEWVTVSGSGAASPP